MSPSSEGIQGKSPEGKIDFAVQQQRIVTELGSLQVQLVDGNVNGIFPLGKQPHLPVYVPDVAGQVKIVQFICVGMIGRLQPRIANTG